MSEAPKPPAALALLEMQRDAVICALQKRYSPQLWELGQELTRKIQALRNLGWVLLCLAFFGCQQFAPPDGVVCIDPALPAEHAAIALGAVALWCADSGGRVALRPRIAEPAAEACDVDVRQGVAHAGDRPCHTAHEPGTTPRVRCDFSALHPLQAVPAMAHELGHAMGAEHSPCACDLMYPVLTNQQHATAADIAQVAP
jgi:hypothetical protein